MIKTSQPALHGVQHLPDGSDPIPGLFSSGDQTTYPAAIRAHPDAWAYWPLDDVSGSPHEVIAGRDLTVNGGGITYGATGPFPGMPEATAVTLDGTADWLSYTLTGGEQAEFLTTVALPWTWVGWFYLTGTHPDVLVTLHNLVSGGGGITQDVYTLGASNHLNMNRYVTNIDSGVVMPPSSWVMVAATYAGSATGIMKLYLSGVQIGTLTETSLAAVGRVMVGATGSVGTESNFWGGRVAQLAMFTAELSAAELLDLNSLQLASGEATSGWVLTADGAGGTLWAAPTIEVDY